MKNGMKNKKIVLGICGGIAAYKSVELLRLLVKQGGDVRVMMTKNACSFIGPLTFQALSGHAVCFTLFDHSEDASIRHIDWAREADVVIIAPATANMVGKLANGVADDALSTFILAVTSPVCICPSMNTHMYESKPVQRNLNVLKNDGCFIIEPGAGELACGTTGPGRLPEPEEIVDRVFSCLSKKDLSGKNVLVTAGPTRESIDPVRFISNPSTGKMGYAVARAAEHRGAEVTLIAGPTSLPSPVNINVIKIGSAIEMAEAVYEHAGKSHIIIKTAAVSDYRPLVQAEHKIKKTKDELVLKMEKTDDILKELGKRKNNQVLVGFAAETRELERHAAEKLKEKNLDIIVGNLIGTSSSGFGSDTNVVTLFYRNGKKEAIPEMEKEEVAHIILDRVMEL